MSGGRAVCSSSERNDLVNVVAGLPSCGDSKTSQSLRAHTHGSALFLCSSSFIARVELETQKLEWLIEKDVRPFSESCQSLPRRITPAAGTIVWIDGAGQTIVEITSSECGGMRVVARDTRSGAVSWERFIPVPDAAPWAEPFPAWPGAQTEEISAFIADDPNRLVICLSRQARRMTLLAPDRGIEVTTLPPFACQIDLLRIAPSTGDINSQATLQDVRIAVLGRGKFSGMWRDKLRAGCIDFDTLENTLVYQASNAVGSPVRDGSRFAIPWHSKVEAGVVWTNGLGAVVRNVAWRQLRVRSIMMHTTRAGFAVQTNDQSLSWLGDGHSPKWTIRARPYIYAVSACPNSSVFVATDGNGGRLLAFDQSCGAETLNLKPAVGGVGSLAEIPAHDLLIASFRTSRSYSVPARLLVLSMEDLSYELHRECWNIIGTWDHGAICRVGLAGEQVAIVDIRN